jgi:hypothetical protein
MRVCPYRLYFQSTIDLFNETNPSGGVTGSRKYLTLLALGAIIGFVVTVKRVYVGIMLGKQTFSK